MLILESQSDSADAFNLIVWKIEESQKFFANNIEFTDFDTAELDKIHVESKQLEWLASRYALKIAVKATHIIELTKNDKGKPIMNNVQGEISLSHTNKMAAAIYHPTKRNGVDIEQIHPRIERIQHKFLKQAEIDGFNPETKIEQLILYWSTKETVFKTYEKGNLSFKNHIHITPFELDTFGMIQASVIKENERIDYTVHYKKLGGHFLTYCIE